MQDKTCFLAFRCSAEDRIRIERSAKKAKLSLSDYLREKAVGK